MRAWDGGREDVGMIPLDFPGYRGQGKLEEVSWDDTPQLSSSLRTFPTAANHCDPAAPDNGRI